MQNNAKSNLLKENPKALQFLHHAHGFDFEKPFFVGSIVGRFTYKTVADMVSANVGPYSLAAVLVKPSKEYSFNKLHHVTLDGHRFNIENKKRVSWYKFDIDYFFSVGDFEETRKHKTECVYIIAQDKTHLVTPKNTVSITQEERYKLATTKYNARGYGLAFDPKRGLSYITEIDLQPANGSRETVQFKPYNIFTPVENRSANILDYLDKSGYIVRFRRIDLKRRAEALKAEKAKKAVENRNFSEENKKISELTAAARKRIVSLVETASTYGDGCQLDRAIYELKNLFFDLERWKENRFPNIDKKMACFHAIEQRAGKILSFGGSEQ